MQRSNLALVALVSVLVATAAWSFSTQAANPTQDDMPDLSEADACRAELEPDVVATGSEVAVGVTFPGDPGEITAVRSEDGSGIVVLGFDPVDIGASALTARLEIPSAAAGAWWLEFDAAGETCKALLTVSESAIGR